ncbi:hypothetical protein LQ953_13850 [Sphingomonas sp. IC-56]|uniref:hypothetical protein n=1 Tax=Sphingomonas sp. IC-56 TaxID=2898529 RepID=UPI001E4C3AC2|nr:hypothetical protein [Sphingomonas sp. IC-56]MCD2325101.1 hypothetical protein [Sphingomonas sp. IC-56]
MRAGEPDKEDVPPPGESLTAKLFRSARGAGRAPAGAKASGQWREAALLAGLIAMGPVLTIAGAQMLAVQERGQAERLEAQLAPRLARRASAEQARDLLSPVISRATLGATFEALARGLPKDASVVRAERGADGTLQLALRTPDPDALRAALRRVPALSGLREVGQQRSDAAMIVLLQGAGT